MEDSYSLGSQLAGKGLVPTGPGVMEGHGYKFIKDASGQWVKVMQAGAPYTAPTPPKPTTSNGVPIPAGVSAHPNGFEALPEHVYTAATKSDNAALKPGERSSVIYYSGSGYSPINGDAGATYGLRGGSPSADAKEHIRKLDAGFKNPECRMKQDAMVFRGSGGKAYFDRFQVGEWFDDKGFVSTSRTTENGFYQNGEVRFHISVPKGHPAIAMGRELSPSHYTEREYLLPRGSKFRVLKKEVIGGRLYIHCEVMPHEQQPPV